MTAREDILDRIRVALKDRPETSEIPRAYRQESGLGEDQLIELLVDRLLDYKARVSVVTLTEAPAAIAGLLAGVTSYVVPHGLESHWLAEVDAGSYTAEDDVTAEKDCRRVDGPGRRLSVAELDTVDAVVTGSAVAVAESGTIILDGGPDQGRRVITLVPDRHICILKSSDITGILPEAMRRLDGTRPLTWISGPSATSDIELERVEGVHGPRHLEVVIVRS